MDGTEQKINTAGVRPETLAMREEFLSGQMRRLKSLAAGDAQIDLLEGADSVWLLVRREGAGGFACRTAYAPGRRIETEILEEDGQSLRLGIGTAIGKFDVRVAVPDSDTPLVHWTTRLAPSENLRLMTWPRDLYLVDDKLDTLAARGQVLAAQRGLNSGIVYLSVKEPTFGSILYWQDLTSLNTYFCATGTNPDGCVGGEWPDLGYQPPVGEKPLAKGEETIIADAIVHWSQEIPADPQAMGRLFLQLVAGIYGELQRPESLYHDWVWRSEQTARDLAESPDATKLDTGYRYVRPYTAAENPDSMVQLTTLLPLYEFEKWSGRKSDIASELRAGIRRFFDPKLSTVRRYLPTVGKDKDADQVDSWYMYHPLTNLGRLALWGDEEAREIFLKACEFGIKVAQHFEYIWPVLFDIKTLAIIQGPRKPGEPGQSDAGGIYAYVMLQAYELTGEGRYVDEAVKAIQSIRGMQFELEYQANISTWGANACLRLWKITGDPFYRDQSYVFLATFFHNCLFWESDIGTAKDYPVFMGATCLHDGPYMAMYECFESYAALQEYLQIGGEDVPDWAALLLSEYCKYTLSRAWFYYPMELPEQDISPKVRNGYINRCLSFPMEDLYADGQLAGQVGQEIYGSGGAFVFATRAYHRLEGAPFLLYCEYPIRELQEGGSQVSFSTWGAQGFSCRARLIPADGQSLPHVALHPEGGEETGGHVTEEGHCEFVVPAGERVTLSWSAEGKRSKPTKRGE